MQAEGSAALEVPLSAVCEMVVQKPGAVPFNDVSFTPPPPPVQQEPIVRPSRTYRWLRFLLTISLAAFVAGSIYATSLLLRAADALLVQPASSAALALARPATLVIGTVSSAGSLALSGTNTMLRLAQSGAEAASLAASLWLYSIRLCRESLAYLASPSSASSTSASAAPPLPLSLRLSAQKMRLLVSELASRHPAHARAGAAREGRAAPAEAAAAAAASHSFSRIQSTFAAARKRLSQHRLLAWAYAE